MTSLRRRSLAFGIGLAFASGAALAADCNPENPECEPPEIDLICHNIGGPMELGANCDGATGACQFTLDTGFTITVAKDHFLGILIPPKSAGALAAHIAHGDGPVEMTFDPALHLASTGQNHKASNVECLGERVLPQPPEPGN
jgi:hypothetical protein